MKASTPIEALQAAFEDAKALLLERYPEDEPYIMTLNPELRINDAIPTMAVSQVEERPPYRGAIVANTQVVTRLTDEQLARLVAGYCCYLLSADRRKHAMEAGREWMARRGEFWGDDVPR